MICLRRRRRQLNRRRGGKISVWFFESFPLDFVQWARPSLFPGRGVFPFLFLIVTGAIGMTSRATCHSAGCGFFLPLSVDCFRLDRQRGRTWGIPPPSLTDVESIGADVSFRFTWHRDASAAALPFAKHFDGSASVSVRRHFFFYFLFLVDVDFIFIFKLFTRGCPRKRCGTAPEMWSDEFKIFRRFSFFSFFESEVSEVK